ncbi:MULTISPECIES: hypothetical protein [Flavobacteriaceae]|uniref:hypothetical protein n=1 Tax=Flavobacteriaceae TaxID=49546 RepID=UPI001491E2BC|nr:MULTISPECIES: hypothetical protein [Allomuricauda]MDC6365997.1 hypothetical protein [Muricauda sp. AC10]
MKNKSLLIILFSFVALTVKAQEVTVKQLNGQVVAQGKDVVGVVIQNSTSQQAVITDIDGNFSITVQLNDTLVFSAVHFRKKVLPVNEVLFNTSFVTVPLEEFVNELQEVVVRPYNLSGDLNQDVTQLNLPKDVSAEALGLPNAQQEIPTQSERKLQEASSGMYSLSRPLAVGLSPIINAITGRTKMLKNRVKVDTQYARTQRVQDFYVDSLFVTTLKIPMEKVEDFMYFCEVDEKFQQIVDSHDKLKIWDFMVTKSRAYRENNNLD